MKKILAFILVTAFCCSLFVGIIVPASAADMIPSAYPDKLAQNVTDYMEGISQNTYVPVWIYLTTPSTAEIEAIVRQKVSEKLSPQEYYEARLKVIKEIYSDITTSFIDKYLDTSCIFYYQSDYTTTLAIGAPKGKVLELAENDLVIEISLYEDFEIDTEEVPTNLSPELREYLDSVNQTESVPVWISLTSPSTAEIEAIVKREVSDELNPQEYYEARLKAVREIYSGITGSFAETYLDNSCTIYYQSSYTASLAIKAPKAKVLELSANNLVVEISLYKDFESETEEESKLSPELKIYLNSADKNTKVPIWVYLTSPSTAEIEAAVKEKVSDNLAPQEYYEARNKVIKEIYSNITNDFVQNHLGDTCTILYQSQYSATVAIEASKNKVLELEWLDTVKEIGLFTDYEPLPEINKLLLDFKDLPKVGTWQYDAIAYCVEHGIMNGMSTTEFSPNGNLTRGQLVTVLYRVAGKPEVSYEKVFPDVRSNEYYTLPIIWAAKNGIVNGFEDGTFRPNTPVTREQLATILYRYSGSPAVSGDLSAYPDAAAVQSYSKLPMLWATQNGFLTGETEEIAKRLAPRANAARVQIAGFIMRYLES